MANPAENLKQDETENPENTEKSLEESGPVPRAEIIEALSATHADLNDIFDEFEIPNDASQQRNFTDRPVSIQDLQSFIPKVPKAAQLPNKSTTQYIGLMDQDPEIEIPDSTTDQEKNRQAS